jgi:hypothetical protein
VEAADCGVSLGLGLFPRLIILAAAAGPTWKWWRWWLEDGGALVGYVRSAKVAVLANCLENVLSKTSAYIPPRSTGTSYFPSLTLSASHFPGHKTKIRPMLLNFWTAVEESLREEGDRRPAASTFGVAASTNEEDARLGVREAPVPGCLNMPKFLEICQGAP